MPLLPLFHRVYKIIILQCCRSTDSFVNVVSSDEENPLNEDDEDEYVDLV